MQTDRSDMGTEKEKRDKLTRQANMVKHITIESIQVQAKEQSTYMLAVTAGIMQGLKYEGSFKRGIKAGLVVYTVLITSKVVSSLARNMDEIKNA